jgi:hypothetical protein
VEGVPAGVARQWAALGAVAGGWYLLGDDATALAPSARSIFFAPLHAGAVVAAQPRFGPQAHPPKVWASDTSLAVFNWTDAPLEWSIPADDAARYGTMISVFDPEASVMVTPGLTLEVPANDVVFLVAAD